MSTLTSIFGMLPLMLIPGAGSQIYRGLATVIIGGMFVSAIFTLVLIPSILRLPPVQWAALLSYKKKTSPNAVNGVPVDA